MRIAYLIRAYTDPPQLQRLIEALSGDHAYFFVHVQPNLTLLKNIDIAPFREATKRERKVRFVDRRLRVNWGGFTMVETTLALMREALNSGIDLDYHVLLSGLDYPIKSNPSILEYFARQRGREFIRYVSIRDEPSLEWKVGMKWFNERVLFNNALRRARKLKIWGGVQEFLFDRRGFPAGFEPFCGPTWWALTQRCVEYIVRFLDEEPELVDFYRYTDQPDEGFFQTVIMNSEFGKRTNQRVEYEEWGLDHPVKHAGDLIMYVKDFLKGRSAVLDEQDFGRLEESNCLFARKFTSARSLKLVERVDKDLLGRDPRARATA